eukprot:4240917-Pleurochrysis_carterae.AAC.2
MHTYARARAVAHKHTCCSRAALFVASSAGRSGESERLCPLLVFPRAQAIARWTGAEEDAAVLEWVGRVRSLMGVGASDGRAADAHAPADDSHHAHDAHDARQADAHAGQAHGSHVAPLALQPSRASDAARAVHRGIAAGGAIAAHGVRLYAGWAIGTLPLDEALYGSRVDDL